MQWRAGRIVRPGERHRGARSPFPPPPLPRPPETTGKRNKHREVVLNDHRVAAMAKHVQGLAGKLADAYGVVAAGLEGDAKAAAKAEGSAEELGLSRDPLDDGSIKADTKKIFQCFYERLKEVKDYHRSFPGLPSPAVALEGQAPQRASSSGDDGEGGDEDKDDGAVEGQSSSWTALGRSGAVDRFLDVVDEKTEGQFSGEEWLGRFVDLHASYAEFMNSKLSEADFEAVARGAVAEEEKEEKEEEEEVV